MLVLGVPTATLDEVHQLLKMGGDVVRPIVQDLPGIGEMIPLARVRFVDVNTTVPLAQQTGTIARPFATIQQAVDALPAPGGVVMIAPGSYTEPSITVPATDAICFVGWAPPGFGAPNVTISNSINSTADIGAFNLTIANALTTSQRMAVNNCNITNLVATGGLNASNCTFTNTTAGGSSVLKECTLTGATNSFATADLQGVVSTGGAPLTFSAALTARSCVFATQLTCSTTANLWKCRCTALAITGALTSDYDSIAGVSSISFGSFVLSGPQSMKATVSVPVPGVAAGQVGYADVALGATILNGLVDTGTMLVANATVDVAAAGAGGGFINVRGSAANTARFAFVGPISGGNRNFLLGVL